MVHTPAGAAPDVKNSSLSSLDFLWLELTPKCNLACVHCYVSSTPNLPLYGNLTNDDWATCLSEAFELGCRSVQFIGGEPTLYPYLPELLCHARMLGFQLIEVFTNGVHLPARLRSALVENQVSLAFSVYASDPSIHDSVTQREGSFSKTIENIQWALAEGLSVRAGVIEMPLNAGTVSSTMRYLQDLGVQSVGFDSIRGVGRGKQDSSTGSGLDELCGKCWQGKLCVTAEGVAYPCVMARDHSVGDLQTLGLKGLAKSESLISFRQHQRKTLQASQSQESCGPCAPQMCYPTFCMP